MSTCETSRFLEDHYIFTSFPRNGPILHQSQLFSYRPLSLKERCRVMPCREKLSNIPQYLCCISVQHTNDGSKQAGADGLSRGGRLVAINSYLRGTFALRAASSRRDVVHNNGALKRRESLSHRNGQSAGHCLSPPSNYLGAKQLNATCGCHPGSR